MSLVVKDQQSKIKKYMLKVNDDLNYELNSLTDFYF